MGEQEAGTFNGWAGTTTVSGNFTISGGTYNASTNTVVTGLSSTLDFNGSQEFYNFSFSQNNISGKIVSPGDTLVVLNNLAFNDGQVNSTGLIEARGNVYLSTNFDGANTALKFTGSSTSGSINQTFNLSGTSYLYDGDITVDKSEGEVILQSNLLTNTTNQDIVVNSGTLNLNSFALSATGTNSTVVVQGGGTLKLVGSETITATTSPTFAASSTVMYFGTTTSYTLKSFTYGNLTIAGNGGTFTPSGTTLSILGNLNLNAGIFNASAVTDLYGNFSRTSATFNPNSGTVNLLGGDQAIFGSSTFYNLSKSTTTTHTLTFASSTTQTITNTLTLQGGASQQLLLRSDSLNTQWKIDPQATRNISYVNVRDSNNINGTSITASGSGSTNSGNNINWDFGTSYSQNQYRFYENNDALQPTVPLVGLNSTTTLSSTSSPIRLRMNLTVSTADLGTSSQAFLLQFATSTSGAWTNVANGQAWEFYNNPSVPNTSTVSSILLTGSDVTGLYMETNPSGLNPVSVSVGQNIEYDFPIKPTNAATTTYFFRVVKSDTASLSAYNNYPTVTISFNSAPSAPSTLGPASYVNGSWVSSTTPTFTFSLADPEVSDTVKYLFQLSTSSTFSNLSISYLSALDVQGSKSFRVGQSEGSGLYLAGSSSVSLVQANYFWRVFAIDSLGATSSTSTANNGAIAFRQDSTGPTAGTLSVATTSTTSLTASISGASDSGVGLAGTPYVFYNSTAGSNSSATSSTSWLSSGLIPNTQYNFYTDVTDSNGNSSSSTSAQIYTLAQAPSSLVLSVNSGTQITASWSGGSNSAGTLYLVTNETTGDMSTWTSANTSIFSSLICETLYSFSVKAKNGDGHVTASSSLVSATTSSCQSQGSGGGGSGGGGGGGTPTPPVTVIPPAILPPPEVVVIPPPQVTPIVRPVLPILPAAPIVIVPQSQEPIENNVPAASSTPLVGSETPADQGQINEFVFEWPVINLPKIPPIELPDISFELPDFSKPVEKIAEKAGVVIDTVKTGVKNAGVKIFDGTFGVFKSSYNNIALGVEEIKKVTKSMVSSLEKPKNVGRSFVVLAVAPSFLAAEYSIAAQGLKLAAGSWLELWLSFLSLLQGLLTSLGLRKRRRIWGTVYDSENKQPLDPALVQLVEVSSGKIVQKSITDLYGRFGFLDKPGEYFITAVKTHYSFPSKNISGSSDGVFSDLYYGTRLRVVKGQELLVPNIPMDPLEYDWNQQAKAKILHFNPRLEHAVTMVLRSLFWAGFAFTVFVAIKETTVFNAVVVFIYLLMSLLRKFIPHRHLWGRLYSESEILEGLLLELYHPKIPSVVLSRALAARDGKFFLKAKPGEYMCRVKKIEGETVKTVLETKVKIGADGVVNDEIKI
ncbi:MAG: hypothetical protein JNN11_05450 [Candidatus Doudnabacteria bacterium]|nr:hypothetical protein [Candidatus Doudnabacteria bacterium]